MKILIDIGHPAHVHYFKHFTRDMLKKNNKVLFSARNRGEIFELLESYGFEYFDRGKGCDSLVGKSLNIIIANYRIFKKALFFKPDIFLGFGSLYAAQVSAILHKPCVLFDDTEFSSLNIKLYKPFTDVIFTPVFFKRKLGKKQIRFNSLMELCYLHPKRFTSKINVYDLLGVKKGTKYVVIRFVAFKAIHDIGVVGFTTQKKIELVKKLEKHAKVFISSERELPHELKEYKLNIPAKYLHDVISKAELYIGDSQTTTTEACCLGIPAVRCNTFAKSSQERANFLYLEEKGLLFNYNEKDVDLAINKILELIQTPNLRKKWKIQLNNFLKENIDITALLIWIIEDYPESINQFQENPGLQNQFQ